jgi:serine/threonine protein phosphatase PrpC
MEGEVYADICSLSLHLGDRFLICTDGLTSMVADDRIEKVLRENDSPESSCKELVQAALAEGGKDNVTTVIMEIRSQIKAENLGVK